MLKVKVKVKVKLMLKDRLSLNDKTATPTATNKSERRLCKKRISSHRDEYKWKSYQCINTESWSSSQLAANRFELDASFPYLKKSVRRSRGCGRKIPKYKSKNQGVGITSLKTYQLWMEARVRVTLFWYKPSLLCYGNCSWKILACEQALLFGRAKRASRERENARSRETRFPRPNRRACSQARKTLVSIISPEYP